MTSNAAPHALRDALRQMLAVLEDERQAIAGLDLDAIVGTTRGKDRLCCTIDSLGGAIAPGELDDECRALLETARRLNEVNRQVRNIVAANVSRRLDVLTGAPQLYRAAPAYAVTGYR